MQLSLAEKLPKDVAIRTFLVRQKRNFRTKGETKMNHFRPKTKLAAITNRVFFGAENELRSASRAVVGLLYCSFFFCKRQAWLYSEYMLYC